MAMALLAFWPRYLAQLGEQRDIRFHFHAVALGGWCLLLILQAYLIRTNRRDVHRQVGKISYVWAPLVALSIPILAQVGRTPEDLTGARMVFVLGILGDTILFTTAYTLAMLNRKKAAIHARYMVCTGIVVSPAIFDRLFSNYLGIEARVGEDGIRLAMILALLAAELLLAGLVLWDRKSIGTRRVFALMLGVVVVVHWIPFVIYRTQIAEAIAVGFLSLPLP